MRNYHYIGEDGAADADEGADCCEEGIVEHETFGDQGES